MMQAQNAETKALVTGGAQGIGFAIANQLVAEGCKPIALIGRDKDKGAKAVAKLAAAGAQAIFISADISDEKRRYAYRKDLIRVNAVLPGWMDTEGEDLVQKKWHNAPDNWLEIAEKNAPMGQLVKPKQLAHLVAYMLSPNAGVMTGALVDYDQNIIGPSG